MRNNKSIPVPIEETHDQVIRQVKQNIAMGKCKFSNLIVPQVMKKIQQIYKRTSMPKCDFNKPSFNYRKIVSKKVTIGGRKISITKKEKNF